MVEYVYVFIVYINLFREIIKRRIVRFFWAEGVEQNRIVSYCEQIKRHNVLASL
jgi:hypothetical protein